MIDRVFRFKIEDLDHKARVDRLKSGDYSFGCAGMHRGSGNDGDCPYWLHHHHDEFCAFPTLDELLEAGIEPEEFRIRSRR